MASTKNQAITRLKEELDNAIKLVVHARESLDNELDSEWAQKKLSVDKAFLGKLKELTASFNSLTEAKIRLDKAEKAMEEDMSPQEEYEAVLRYLADMDFNDLQIMFKKARILRKSESGEIPVLDEEAADAGTE